jgi:hypothetical protein
LLHLIKSKQHPHLAKKLKTLSDSSRDALLKRYFLKCKLTHSEKFFYWRKNYLKLSVDQRIMLVSMIAEKFRTIPGANKGKKDEGSDRES